MLRVSTDYHVEFKSFFYSVPHALIRQQVDLNLTESQNPGDSGWIMMC
ncbi:hypothetical protein ACC754_36245 [Rhizobium johnstonii]